MPRATVLFGLATIRARVFSRWVGIGFIVLALLDVGLSFAGFPGVLVTLAAVCPWIGVGWFGVELWKGVAGKTSQ